MYPLDDINPEIYNYPSGATLLEFIGAMIVAFVVAMMFQYIISEK